MNNLASDPTQRLRKIEATQVYWRRRFKPGEVNMIWTWSDIVLY